MTKRTKSYWEMSSKELARNTAQFDEVFVIDESQDATPEERRQWQQAKRKRGRPKVGKGVRVVSVSIETGLLERVDRLAKKLKLRRTQLIAQGLEAVLARST